MRAGVVRTGPPPPDPRGVYRWWAANDRPGGPDRGPDNEVASWV